MATLGLTGQETFAITGISAGLKPKQAVTVVAKRADGTSVTFVATARLDSAVDVEYYQNGRILQTVLRKLAGV